MTEEVVVTLCSEEYSCDYSLPANVKLEELYPRLLKVLQNEISGMFKDWEEMLLQTEEGTLLDLSATLYDYGICSGYYLTIVQKR